MANDYSTITVKQVMDAIATLISTNQKAITDAESTMTGLDKTAELISTIQAAQSQIDYATNQQNALQQFVDGIFFPVA